MCIPDLFDLILEHPLDSVFTLVILVCLGITIYLDRRDVLYKSALYIVAKVEEEWGSKTGEIKFAEAYSYLKSKYPILTFFLPEELLRRTIEEALEELKIILAHKAEAAKENT